MRERQGEREGEKEGKRQREKAREARETGRERKTDRQTYRTRVLAQTPRFDRVTFRQSDRDSKYRKLSKNNDTEKVEQ